MTNDCWHSVDADFQDEVGSVSLWFLTIKAANTTIMYNNNQINFQWPDKHDLKLLTLWWHSFCHGCIHIMQSFDLAQSIIHIVLAAFPEFPFTFFLITTLFYNKTYEYTIIITKIPCLSICACHHLQRCSIGYSGLHNGCQLHCHTEDSSVLTSWCPFIVQHIWN